MNMRLTSFSSNQKVEAKAKTWWNDGVFFFFNSYGLTSSRKQTWIFGLLLFFKQFEFVDKSDGWAHEKGRHYTPMTMISPGNKLSVLMGLRKGGCALNGCFRVHFRTCGNKLVPTCYFSLSCCPQEQFITMHADDSSCLLSRTVQYYGTQRIT